MLVDANLLIYAVDSTSPYNAEASEWLESILNGDRRVGIPWQTIGAFLRITTHPRITTTPLQAEAAWAFVDRWLSADPSWIPPATESTAAVLASVLARTPMTGNLIPDAQLAALAIEHGLVVYSADTDFVRFPDVRWHNPLGK
jgi:uncharacterized protein